jgi:hypothetical protein
MEQRTMELGDFYALSVSLTGFSFFELRALGAGEAYFRTALHEAPCLLPEVIGRYREIERRCAGREEAMERAVRVEIMGQRELGSVARKIIKLWYLGHWDRSSSRPPEPGREDVAGPSSLRDALPPVLELRPVPPDCVDLLEDELCYAEDVAV